jgi:hypothetical protein
VVLLASGRVNVRDVLGADDVIRGDPERLAKLRFLFADYELATGFTADTDGMRELARRGRYDGELVPPTLGVIGIVAPNLLIYGMNRMWMMLANTPFECNVFREREPAIEWLAQGVRDRTGSEIDFSDPAFGDARDPG